MPHIASFNVLSDPELWKHVCLGNESAFEVAVQRYQTLVSAIAYNTCGDQMLSEDVAQETFVRIYQRIRQFDEMRPFAPYLLRSIANAALNAAEKTARWVQLDDGTDVRDVSDLLLHAASVEEQADYLQLKRDVFSALAALSPRQRTAIVQRYYLQMSEKEMAESLS